MLNHCRSLNDVIDDLEATPCPVPVQRVEPRVIDVKSLIGRGDARWHDLPDTLSMTSPGLPDTLSMPSPDSPAPARDSPALRDSPAPARDSRDSRALLDTPAPAPDSPAPFDLLIELDIQQRHEERAMQLLDEYAASQIVEEDERVTREGLRLAVKAYEQVSSDEEAVTRWLASENDSRPQELYSVQRARYLSKRRSSSGHQHEYPAKRGGDSSDALVVVRYPGIDTEFSVRRFGIQEMDALHGKVSKFRWAWLLDYHAELRGYCGEGKRGSNIRLYCADQIYRAQLADVYEEFYYVDLYFRYKFYSGYGKKQPDIEPSHRYQAWRAFVNAYIKANIKEANAYEKSLQDRENRFYNTSVPGVAMKIHELSLKMRMSCTVPVDVECPSCYSLSGRAAIGARPPPDLAVLHARLQDVLKQWRTTTPAPIEHEVVGRLEDEVAKLRADIKLQHEDNGRLEDEVNRLRADNIKLQARNESLQPNITAEVAVQLSQHFYSMASNMLSNNSSC
ncbi:hypothetical protein FI667_g13417, partial [Globisporangium splendens]